METNYINKIETQFRYLTLNSEGVVREVYSKIGKRDIFGVLDMMENNDKEVDNAIREYNVQTHKVLGRPNKPRKNMPAYVTEKLPRNKQQYINETELFFLLGKPLKWKMIDGDAEVYQSYLRFWRRYRLDSMLRKAKRLAGAETECAIVFHLSHNKNADGVAQIVVKPFVAARSTGYRLRPLFDQYGALVTLAYTYRVREGEKNTLHCDILTADMIFYCTKGTQGWEIEAYDNPTRKINAVYFRQPKAWDGAVARIDREERLDSKVADTNNYFADPKAAATADVIANISDPEIAGNMVQLTGSGSKFEYINPPQNSATRQDEKSDLIRSIYFDTFTPDLSYDSLKGLGTLSGAAMQKALTLGYMKRDIRKEQYGELVDRMRSVIFGIMKLTDEKLTSKIDDTQIEAEFQDPFATNMDNWDAIIKLYGAGLCSIESAVKALGFVDNVDEEIDRIKAHAMELQYEANRAKSDSQQSEEGGAQ